MRPVGKQAQTTRQPSTCTTPANKKKFLEENPWATEEDLNWKEPKPKRQKKVVGPDPEPEDAGEDEEEEEDSGEEKDPGEGEAEEEDEDSGGENGSGDEEQDIDDPSPHELRGTWRLDAEDEMSFYTRFLGGTWTKERKGVKSNSVGAFARAGAKNFCGVYGFPKQRVFTFALYGRRECIELAREVCRRGEHFYSIWLLSDNVDYQFTEDDIDSYPESPAFLDFMVALDIEHPAFDAGIEVRRLNPIIGDPLA